MNLSGKAVMMVILTMLMMERITRMTMTEIMMVMTMMVVMLHITDFLLKRRKRNRFVCLFFLFFVLQYSNNSHDRFTAFQKKNANGIDD